MKKLAILVLGLIGLVPGASHGQDCQPPESVNELVVCAGSFAPGVEDARLGIVEAEQGIKAQEQTINPRLDIAGEGIGADTQRLEMGYYHTIERGEKQQRRRQLGRTQAQTARAAVEQARSLAIEATWADLLRLRQVAIETEFLAEARASFLELLERLRKARGLSPEEQASLTLFDMARREMGLENQLLEQEAQRLRQNLAVRLPLLPEQLESMLARWKFSWPPVPEGDLNAPELALAQTKVETAQADLDLAKAQGVSDLELGPRLIVEQSPAGQTTQLGFGLSLPLQLYHRNQGGIGQAQAARERAQAVLLRTEARLRSELNRQRGLYRRAKAAYGEESSAQEPANAHRQLHRQSERGLLGAAIIIEAHRQRVAHKIQRHQLEREGAAAYYRILALKGMLTKGVKE